MRRYGFGVSESAVQDLSGFLRRRTSPASADVGPYVNMDADPCERSVCMLETRPRVILELGVLPPEEGLCELAVHGRHVGKKVM